MSTNSTNIDRLRIATPCPVGWEQMNGDNRIRFCEHCQLNVYNLSELNRREAETLIASKEGRICARLYRRADGTVLTKDCPVGLRALRMRVSKRAAAVFAAIASISSLAFGQQSSAKDGKAACTAQTRITRTKATSDSTAKALSGTVVDPAGALVPGAKVTVTNTGTKEIRETATNAEGRFELASLTPGNYSLKIEAANFKNYELRDVVLEKDTSINFDTILELSGVLMTVGLLDLPAPSVFDTPPGTTIISGDLIRRLPIQH